MDRGVATYPQPLPGEDDRAGRGATEGTSAYASIAALPSATVAVRRGDDALRGQPPRLAGGPFTEGLRALEERGGG
ncbi:MAG TPA: hypothetical protein VHY31_20550 [Streptosporangiaceae bacterium]|nr:hypothetical protein [Streptosporangiaceae bacterium]